METAVRWSALLAELDAAAAESDSAPVFFELLLRRSAAAIEAQAAAFWVFNQQNSVGLLAEHEFSPLGLDGDFQGTRLNQRILSEVFSERSPRVVPFQIRSHPEISFVVLLPVVHQDRCIGVLEFFSAGEPLPLNSENQRAFHDLMLLVDSFFRRLEGGPQTPDPSQFLDVFEKFASAVHSSLDPFRVAVTAVNDVASILKCDRATLLLKQGTRWNVTAVSGRNPVNSRSNQIRLLQQLTQRAVGSRDVFIYTGSENAFPAEVSEPLTDYIRESGCRMLILHPLFEPVSQKHGASGIVPRDRQDGRLFGALVLEQFSSSRPDQVLTKYAHPICDQISLAMSNAIAYHRIPLLRALDASSRLLENCGSRTSARFAFAGCVVMLTLFLLLSIRTEYHVSAVGKLMPVVQRRVFSESDCSVERILVHPGDRVDAGTPLIMLKNEAIDDELLLLRSQRDERRKSLLGLTSELHTASKSGNREHLLQLQAETEQCRIDLANLQYRIGQVEKQIERLTLRAPVAGTVVTFTDEQQLIGKPLRRGDTLMEIMDESGPWQLELEVEEHRMHHLQNGVAVHGERVPASFRLTADPSQEFSGWLSRMGERSALSAETGTVVRICVGFDETAEIPKRIGADVRSKLQCGRHPLLEVWFGDAIDYVRRELWF